MNHLTTSVKTAFDNQFGPADQASVFVADEANDFIVARCERSGAVWLVGLPREEWEELDDANWEEIESFGPDRLDDYAVAVSGRVEQLLNQKSLVRQEVTRLAADLVGLQYAAVRAREARDSAFYWADVIHINARAGQPEFTCVALDDLLAWIMAGWRPHTAADWMSRKALKKTLARREHIARRAPRGTVREKPKASDAYDPVLNVVVADAADRYYTRHLRVKVRHLRAAHAMLREMRIFPIPIDVVRLPSLMAFDLSCLRDYAGYLKGDSSQTGRLRLACLAVLLAEGVGLWDEDMAASQLFTITLSEVDGRWTHAFEAMTDPSRPFGVVR